MQQLAVHFTETAEEEINALITDLSLVEAASYLQKTKDGLPDELKKHLGTMLNTLMDLFSSGLPDVDGDPETALRKVSRDINLSRVLRERGIFRLYRLVNTRTTTTFEDLGDEEISVPLFMTLINPTTGSPFAKQEEFIGWFCSEAKVARSLVFMRIAAIDRIQELGFSLEESFNLIVAKPFAMREVLNMVAKWGKEGELIGVNPDIILQVAERVSPDKVDDIKALADAVKEDPTNQEAQEELRAAAKPVIADLLEEVADHDRAKDALDFVKHNILLKPEIRYTWDPETDTLVVQMIPINVDENGESYEGAIVTIPFVPDSLYIPDEIRDDLVKRLPIRNKIDLD